MERYSERVIQMNGFTQTCVAFVRERKGEEMEIEGTGEEKCRRQEWNKARKR